MSTIGIWIQAIRPKTLVAGIAPVILGTTFAYMRNSAKLWTLPLLLLSSILIQIASNFINDVEDARRGADANRIGPTRAVSAGLISSSSMVRAAIIVMVLAFLCGLPLVFASGPAILAIGLLSLLMSWMYTGGPYPLAYKGLGDVFAFLFFGVIAVVGTYYVHTGVWSTGAFILGMMPGAMAANILGVNNMRDIVTDAEAGKRTIAVRIGLNAARFMYTMLFALALAVPSLVIVFFSGNIHTGPDSWWPALPLVVAIPAVPVILGICRNQQQQLNPYLGATAALYMLLTVLTSVAMILA